MKVKIITDQPFTKMLTLGFLFLMACGFCEVSDDEVMRSEQRLLDLATHIKDPASLEQKIREPLQCLLQIHAESKGFLKSLSSQVLQPFLGGELTKGVPPHVGYSVIAKLIHKSSEKSESSSDIILKYTSGAYDFYSDFCGDQISFCFGFLPDEKKIENEPSVLAASSIFLLKNAYAHSDKSQKILIADRIKKLYADPNFKDPIKRKAINEVYQELFGREHSGLG